MTYKTQRRNYPVPDDGQEPWDEDYQTAMQLLDSDVGGLYNDTIKKETFNTHVGEFGDHLSTENPHGLTADDVVNGVDITPKSVTTDVTKTDELSVTEDSSPAVTKQAIHTLEDLDGSTPLSFDTGQLSHHHMLRVVGQIGRTNGGETEDILLRINGTDDTQTVYSYTYIENGSLIQSDGDTAFREGLIQNYTTTIDWELQQTSPLSEFDNRGATISGNSKVYRSKALIKGTTSFNGSTPVDSLQISTETGVTARAKLAVLGIDYL